MEKNVTKKFIKEFIKKEFISGFKNVTFKFQLSYDLHNS